MHDQANMLLRQQGFEAIERRDFPKAVELLSQYVRFVPRDVDARSRLGWAQSECRMYPQALANVDAAVMQQPDRADGHYFRGVVLARVGRTDDAIAAMQRTLRHQPGHPAAAAWLEALHQAAANAPAPPQPHEAPEAEGQLTAARVGGAVLWGLNGVLGRVFGCGLIPLLLLGPLAMIWMGQEREKEGRELRKQVVLSHSQFVAQKPKKGWFKITGCALDVSSALWVETEYNRGGKMITDVYVPVYDIEKPDEEQVHVLVSAEDPAIRALVQEMADLQRSKGEAAVNEWAVENLDRLWIERDVEGIVQTGFRKSDWEHQEAAKVSGNFAPGFVVLDDEKPDRQAGSVLYWLGVSIYAMIFLVALVFAIVWLVRRDRENRPAIARPIP